MFLCSRLYSFTFLICRYASLFLDTTETVHGSAGQVVAGDVVIAISNSGNTKELEYALAALKANGAVILAVTGNEDSSLASCAEVTLSSYVSQEGTH